MSLPPENWKNWSIVEMSMPHAMELLAPAGNAETALAALDAGADAIYCGLGRFNARARAENFTPDIMAGVIERFHECGKKVYLTLNTLIYESELPRLMETLCEIDRLMPDALIVQDLGVASIVSRYFPQLTLHASTQMGIHNSAGVAFAAKLGFKRVILERQIPLDELRLIAASSPLELEVFIHGSLCCSLSGRCLLSHHLFGAGGNRGVCKQPCRRAYDREYRLSPSDLIGASYLPELRKMGIASLKIEGRLRPPEYVWKCTRAYRMLLDAGDAPDEATIHEAETLLASASGRANDRGFFDPARYGKLIDVRRPGVFGIPVGTVLRSQEGSILVRLQGRLHLGDRLRIVPPEGGEGETFSLVLMRDGQKNLLKAKGGTVEIATSCRAVKGSQLLKIGENGFDFTRRLKNLPPRRECVDLKIEITAQNWRITSPRLAEAWEKAIDLAPAKQHALVPATVAEVFASGMPEKYRAGKVTASIKGALFVPASVIKAIRREFWEKNADRILPEVDRAAEAMRRFTADHEMLKGTDMIAPSDKLEAHFYGFLPETKITAERERFSIAQKSGKCIAAEGLHALDWLAPSTGKVFARFPIAVTNSFAAQLLADLGIAATEAAPELPAREREKLAQKSPIPLLPYREVPLLVTRLPLIEGVWHDAAHHAFTVRRNEEQLSEICTTESLRSKVFEGDDAVDQPSHDRQ